MFLAHILISPYYIFYAVLLLSCLQVIVLNNPIYSVLYLIIVFIVGALLLITAGVQFLGLVLLIVYLGAVVVLFLFVVMLLNIKILELKRGINFYPFLLICGVNILLSIIFIDKRLLYVFDNNFLPVIFLIDWSHHFFIVGAFKAVANVLYTINIYQFFASSLVLFIAMVGAILLTLTQLKRVRKPAYHFQILRTRNTVLMFEL
jgi:NADH-quinone oxidoreductase subunit J